MSTLTLQRAPHDLEEVTIQSSTDNPVLDCLINERVTLLEFAKRRGFQQADAEDLLTQVEITVLSRNLDHVIHPRGYLKAMIANQAASYNKLRNRLYSGYGDDDKGTDISKKSDYREPLPIQSMLLEECRMTVNNAVENLPSLDRRTLEEFYFQELNLKEISDVENAPVGTIKRRLHTARHRLAASLGSEYSEDS